MKPATKNMLASFIIALAVFLVWVFILPSYESISDSRTKISVKKEELVKKEAILQKIVGYGREYERRLAEVGSLSLVVPEGKGVPELISALESMTTESGLQLSSLILGENASSTGDSNHEILTAEVILSGDYLSVINFLSLLENNIRLMDVSEINISIDTSGQLLNIKMKVSAYYVKKQSEPLN